jgi:hypothetical protein
MRQKRSYVNVALCDSAILFARIVNDRNQPVTILPNVEDHVSIHIIGIFEHLPYFNEVSPPHLAHDPVPGSNLPGRLGILFFGLNQVFACNNVHGGSQVSSAGDAKEILTVFS